ncbi:MAG: TetR/AcrR family transcriptional regulator [Deltaproteobacteria bacterium]|nr:TetR/AcrR family transcriptional regulator [Deltaproteobacteria bacterium]
MSDHDARERVLSAALALFAARGFGSTSVRDVARAAGVTNPTLYYHFGNKECLYLEAIAGASARFTERIEAAVSGAATFDDKLIAYVEAQLSYVREFPAEARLLAYANHGPLQGDPSVDLMSHHLRSSQVVLEMVAQGKGEGRVRPEVRDEDVMMLLTGSALVAGFALLAGYPMPADYPERVRDTMLRGIGAETPSNPTGSGRAGAGPSEG